MAAKSQNQRRTIPLAMNRGMWASGDGAMMPAGYARKIRNMHRVDGVWAKRPQFTADALTNVQGLGTFEDDTNKVTRLTAIDDDGNFRLKGIDSEAWGAPVTGSVSGTRLTSFATYRGKGWGALDDGSGVPQGIFSFDGETVDPDPLTSAIVGRILLFYKERLFLFHPRVEIENLLPWQAAYTAADGNWSLADVDARTITSGATSIGEIIPTADTGAYLYRNVEQVVALTDSEQRNWLAAIHNTAANYQMPMTLQIQIANAWETVTPYAAEEIVTPSASNGYRYRAISGGTSGVAEPTWPTTIGDTVADSTITWLCDATNVLAERQIFVPSASIEPKFSLYAMSGQLPPTPGEYTLRVYMLFGNDSSATVTQFAMHIGFRDGIADGTPGKQNYGQQVTRGDYFYPFFNVETDTPPVLDLDEAIYSEVADPPNIRAISSYNFGGAAGYTQAAVVFDGRIYVFKRRSFVRLIAVEDENIVVLPEGDETLGIGCLGPQALDIQGGAEDRAATLYWIGEDSVWALRAGTGEVPRDICGDRMRADVMDKGANWVENQAAPNNAPLLCIDQHLRLIYVYTQKGRVFVYSIRDDAWSFDDAGGDASVAPFGAELRAMRYHPETRTVYFSFGTATLGSPILARLDATQAEYDDQVSTLETKPVLAEFWPRALETTAPHTDLLVETIRFRHKATADQSGQLLVGQYSTDGGVTFPAALGAQLDPVSGGGFIPCEMPVYQSWNTVQPRIYHVGKGGAAMFAVSEVEADVKIMKGYYSKNNPIFFGGSTL